MKICPSCGARFDSEIWACASCGWEAGPGPYVLLAPELAVAGDGFDPQSFELLPEAEELSFWFRARNELIAWALRRHFPQARRFLELGSGTGVVLAALRRAFPSLELTGSELSRAGLNVARERLPDVTLLQLDARRIPFDVEFDVVGAFDVLEHIDEDEAVLAQMFQAVKPGGGVLVSVPQHGWLWSAADEFGRHRRRYGRRELVAKLERAGFAVERVTSFVSLLLPLMALSRLRQRRLGEFDPMDEYRIGARANAALRRVMKVELALITRGVSLPAGGSLLAVARR